MREKPVARKISAPLNLDYTASKRNIRQPVCERFAQSVQVRPGVWRYAPMNCRSLRCERCAQKVAAKRAREIEAAAREHSLTCFITLTLGHVRELSQVALLRHLRASWAKLRVYFRRRYKQSIRFIAVVEVSSSLMPHLHVLVDRHIDEHWLAQAWPALGGGPFMKVENVRDPRGLSVYLTKQLAEVLEPVFPSRIRRVTTSRGIRLSSYRSKNVSRAIFQPVHEIKALAGDSLLEDNGDSFLADRGDLGKSRVEARRA